jgi:hypothetical protein
MYKGAPVYRMMVAKVSRIRDVAATSEPIEQLCPIFERK